MKLSAFCTSVHDPLVQHAVTFAIMAIEGHSVYPTRQHFSVFSAWNATFQPFLHIKSLSLNVCPFTFYPATLQSNEHHQLLSERIIDVEFQWMPRKLGDVGADSCDKLRYQYQRPCPSQLVAAVQSNRRNGLVVQHQQGRARSSLCWQAVACTLT